MNDANEPKQGKRKRWSAEEIETLRELYPTAPSSEIMMALPLRSPHSINVMATKLRILRARAWADCSQADPIFKTLRQRRLEAHLSARALAKKIGVTESSVSQWERGRVGPSWFMFRAWLSALGMEIVVRPARALSVASVSAIALPRQDQMMARR